VLFFPLLSLLFLVSQDGLGANPIEFSIHYLGGWGLKLLLITLLISPLRILLNWNWLSRNRRLFGLFSFFYISLHIIFYVGIDQFFNWHDILDDVFKRMYITVGLIAFLLLIPLALTSTKKMIKKIGGKIWIRIHKGIYIAAVLACLHFFMMRKGVQFEPLFYAGLFSLLFLFRIYFYIRRKNQ
jgi:sulfoxide reductase heme-binding subunit YedZ